MNKMISNDYLERVNRVIDHVSTHLASPISLDGLAEIACFSPFHFHRVFKAITGETVNEFVKRIRLERAASLLKNGDRRSLTEIAFSCGFNSSADFSRSFKKHFAFPPSQLDRGKIEAMLERRAKEDPERSLCALYSGDDFVDGEFEVDVTEEPPTRVAYVRIFDPIAGDNLLRGFERLIAWAREHGIAADATMFGISQDDLEITPAQKYRYDFCITAPPEVRAEGDVGVRVIPGGLYASLHIEGDIHRVARGWDYLYRYWLLRSRYQPSHEPALEVYRRSPAEIGWETWDLDARIPISPF